MSRPKWQRALILVMGPVFNVILAVVVLTISFMSGITIDKSLEEAPRVEWIEKDSPASAAGVEAGDLIMKINDQNVSSWNDVQLYTVLNGKKPLVLTLKRSGKTIERTLKPELEGSAIIPRIGLRPRVPAIMGVMEKGAPADRAGFKSMDRIVSINGTGIEDIDQAVEIIHHSAGVPLTIAVERKGQLITHTVVPEKRGEDGIIGFIPYYPEQRLKLPLVPAFRKSIESNFDQAFLLVRILKMMVEGEVSVKTVSGPIEIAKFSREAARTGTLLPFIAFISLQLGIVNLLPIPVLDGGHLLIILLESVARREFSLRLKERIMKVGVILLVAIMFFVIINDLSKVSFLHQYVPSW